MKRLLVMVATAVLVYVWDKHRNRPFVPSGSKQIWVRRTRRTPGAAWVVMDDGYLEPPKPLERMEIWLLDRLSPGQSIDLHGDPKEKETKDVSALLEQRGFQVTSYASR